MTSLWRQFHEIASCVARMVRDCSDTNAVLIGAVTASCTSNANPYATIIWKYPHGVTTANSSQLLFNKSLRSDSGNYTCLAENTFYDGELGHGDASIEIDVQYPPSVSFTSPMIYREGEHVSLNCNVYTANPMNSVVEWFRNGLRVQVNNEYVLNNVTRDESGKYTCRATNTYYDGSHGSGSVVININVQYVPVINVDDRVWFREGDQLLLQCAVDANPRPHYVRWSKEEEFLTNETNYEVSAITRNDGGNYTCIVKNELYDATVGVDESITEVIVEYQAVVDIIGADVPLMEGQQLNVTCTVIDGYPRPYMLTLLFISKYDNKTKMLHFEDGATMFMYQIATTKFNNGVYYCMAATEYHDSTKEEITSNKMNIIVYYAPTITGDSVKVLADDDAMLVCNVDAYPRVESVTWIDINGAEMDKNSITVEFDGNIVTSTVLILNVKSVNEGRYTCIAENTVDTTKHVIELSIDASFWDYFKDWRICALTAGICIILIIIISVGVTCIVRRVKKHTLVPHEDSSAEGYVEHMIKNQLIGDIQKVDSAGVDNQVDSNDDIYAETTLSTFKGTDDQQHIDGEKNNLPKVDL